MPIAWSLPTVVLVWLLRASALRFCAYVIVFATFSSQWSVAGESVIHQERIRAIKAVCNWQTVRSGFFPPFLSHLGQEQIAYHRQNEVAFQAEVSSALVLVHADFALVILKASFHTPARQGHQQQFAGTGLRRSVADVELQLSFMEHIASDEQMHAGAGQTILVLDGQEHFLAFPHHRAIFAILDTPTLPGLISNLGVVEPGIDPPGLGAVAGQTWHLPGPSTAAAAVRSRHYA